MSQTSASGTSIELTHQSLIEKDEFDLILEVAIGNENAFAEIYQRHHLPLYNYLLHIIQDAVGAEDVLQEVFLAVWLGAAKFQQKSSLKTWMYRIGYKKSITWLRNHHRKLEHLDLDALVDDKKGPEETAETAAQIYLLNRAVMLLPTKHRAVLVLAFVHDMSYREIAEVLGCPVGTVKSRMSYALKSVSHIVKNVDNEAWINYAKARRS